NSVFGLPEVSLGLIPGFGGTQRLGKIIGRAKAKELIFTGRNIKAEEALNLGLVISLHDSKQELLAAAKKVLSKAMTNSPFAIAKAKEVINQGIDLPIEQGFSLEQKTFGAIFSA